MEPRKVFNDSKKYIQALKCLKLLNSSPLLHSDTLSIMTSSSTSTKHQNLLHSTKEIEQAYRKLALEHHPDRGGDEKSFLRIKSARDYLVTGGAIDCSTFLQDDEVLRTSDSIDGANDVPKKRNKKKRKTNSSSSVSSKVLLRGRSCIRDLATHYDSETGTTTVVAATDEGLKNISNNQQNDAILQNIFSSTPSVSPPSGNTQDTSILNPIPILTCDISSDARFVFAGTKFGQVHRYLIAHNQCPTTNTTLLDRYHDGHDTNVKYMNGPGSVHVVDHLIGNPTTVHKSRRRESFDELNNNDTNAVVSVIVQDMQVDTGLDPADNNSHFLFAACESPPVISVLAFHSTFVETIWNVSNVNNGIHHCIHTIDSLHVTTEIMKEVSKNNLDSTSTSACCTSITKMFNVWCGGSNSDNEAVLMRWNFDPTNNNTVALTDSQHTMKDDEYYWSDSSLSVSEFDSCQKIGGRNDDYENIISKEPSILYNNNLGFGSIYSIDACSSIGILALTIGSDVILSEETTKTIKEVPPLSPSSSPEVTDLQIRHTLTTNHTLYCVKILERDLQVAAAGTGGSIFLWSLITGTITRNIRISTLQHCNLCTNCVMTLDILKENFSSSSTTRTMKILSGGYDGDVTHWTIDGSSSCDDEENPMVNN